MAVVKEIESFLFLFLSATFCLIFEQTFATLDPGEASDRSSRHNNNISTFFKGSDVLEKILPDIGGNIVIINENVNDDHNDDDDLATTFLSAFYANSTEQRVKALRRLEGRRLWYGPRNNGDDEENERETRTVECLCEVTINGRHHVSGEVAVCGMTNRIQCPYNVGCQKALATTSNGFVSIVKSCGIGNELASTGCRTRREQAPYVDRINVMRCICMGRLCNHGGMGPYEGGNLVWFLTAFAIPIIIGI